MTEPAPFARSACANRAQRYRQRQRAGLQMFNLPLDAGSIQFGAILAGLLTDEEALNPTKVKEALVHLLHSWAEEQKRRHA